MAVRAVVFDLDGTLVDTAPDLWRATNHILTSLGRQPLSLDDVRSFVGDSETDVLTARAAGVPVIGVTFGYALRPVADFSPDYLISHFDEGCAAIGKALDS